MSMTNNNEKIGSVRIATDVVPLIAALASQDVEGVTPLQDKKSIKFKMNLKRLTRGMTSKEEQSVSIWQSAFFTVIRFPKFPVKFRIPLRLQSKQ